MIMGRTWTHLESSKSFKGPLLPKPVTGQEQFFAVSYSKPALIIFLKKGASVSSLLFKFGLLKCDVSCVKNAVFLAYFLIPNKQASL